MLKNKVLETIKKYNMINENDKNILIAVSGGYDSTCLLYLLNELKQELNFSIYVAHINHCLRENAILDEQYVIQLCKKLNVECFIEKIDVKKLAKDKKMSLEMAGRQARYEYLDRKSVV